MSNITVRNKELYKINLIVGISILVISLILASGTSLFFLFGMIITAIALSLYNGVEINSNKHEYRNFKSYFGIRKGKWNKIPNGASLVILSKHGKQTASGGRGAQEINRTTVYYELYLMNENHRNRFFIHNSEEKIEIETLARKISEQSKIEIKKYSPN